MKKRINRKYQAEADLDITAFMNLMIVLVPVLLLGMVFSQITVVEVTLPDTATAAQVGEEQNQQLELIVRQDSLEVNYPAGNRVKMIPRRAEGPHNYELLSLTLQEIKRLLREKNIDKKDITILSESQTNYQTLISAMDTVRSYQAVVAASVVDAELFPNVSFGDATHSVGLRAEPGGDS